MSQVIATRSELYASRPREGIAWRGHILLTQKRACYARGRHVRDLASIIGSAALGEDDRRYLTFADDFEQRFIGQGTQRRGLEETLDLAWALLGHFPRQELKRIRQRHLDRHHSQVAQAPRRPDPPDPG